MRNPIRLKNFNARFLPLYLVGLAILLLHPVQSSGLVRGLPPIALGLAIRAWGAGHLVKTHGLTVTGPYAHLRHPLYAGTLLIATGFALVLGGWLSLILLAVIWLWFGLLYLPRKDRSEAERLERVHGDAFVRYREAVPLLWPRLAGWPAGGGDPSAVPAGAAWSARRYSENNELGTLLAVAAGLLVFALRAALADS
jgi:hypothetical protein